MSAAADFAAVGLALYAAHHVGDYWVQTDRQARYKGLPGADGRKACTLHVLSYLLTQALCLTAVRFLLDVDLSNRAVWAGLAVSGVTHYLADRREHGVMFALARLLPGKADFLKLGVPREVKVPRWERAEPVPLDNPSLGTGAWALDQAWHIFWGVFVAALVMVTL